MVDVHGLVGWSVLAGTVVAGLHARARVRSGRPFEPAPYRLAAVAVDVAILLGILAWVDGEWWDVTGRVVSAWVHPGLAIATLVVTHLGMRKARDERWAAEAYAIAGRTLLASAVLLGVVGAVAVRA